VRLKSLIASISFSISLGLVSVAAAADTSTALVHEGQPGVWFPEAQAARVLKDVEELRVVREVVRLQERQLQVRAERLQLEETRNIHLREALDLSIKSEERIESVVEAAIRGERLAKEERDAWYRSPSFIIPTTVVGVIGLQVAAVLVINTLDKR
jgi:hypothetical protein